MNKQSFRRHNSVFRSGLLSGSLPWILLGVVILLILSALRVFAPQTLTLLGTPAWNAGQQAAMIVSGAPDEASLQGAVVAAEAENAALIAQNAQLQARVADLTTLLGSRTEPEKGIVAGVVARPPVAPYDVLVIDQGAADGVQLGARAYGVGGTPIGAVTEVASRSARITLYSTRGSVQQAWAGDTRAPVELSGMGSGAFEAISPRGTAVAVGNTVFIAGGGALPIGTVVAMDDNPSSPNVALYIRPFTNPFSMTWVTVDSEVR